MFHFLFTDKNGKNLISQMKLSELIMDKADCYLPIKWNETKLLYSDNNITIEQYQNNKNIVGIHWFNGAKESKDYCNNLDKELLNKNFKINCLMDKLVKDYIK